MKSDQARSENQATVSEDEDRVKEGSEFQRRIVDGREEAKCL